MPETLHALIAARLDGLTADERHVVQNGAVLGKTFTRAAVAALTGEDDARLEPVLTALVRKEVLSMQADPRSPEHGQYGFLQDLMRRVAYETLSHARAAGPPPGRGRLPRVVGRGRRRAGRDAGLALPGRLRGRPRRRGRGRRCATRAQALFVRAAWRAVSLGATAEAYRYFTQAAELTDDELERAVLLDQAGHTAGRAGRPEDGQDAFERAIAIYERRGDTHAAARVTARLAYSMERVGQHREAIERMEAALNVIGDDEPDADVALVTVRLGNALLFTGELDRGGELIERALDMGEALGCPRSWSTAGRRKGVWMARGRRREAVMLLQRGRRPGARAGPARPRQRRALATSPTSRSSHDDYAAALVHLDRGREIARRSGDRPNEWFCLQRADLSRSTSSAAGTRRWRRSRSCREEQLSIGFTLLSPITSVLEIHIHRGDLDEARGCWRCTSR